MKKFVVVILESPSPADLRSGRTEGQALTSALELTGIPHSYELLVTRDLVLQAIDQSVVDAERRFGLPAIIHLSCHGSRDCLAATCGSKLEWSELAEHFRAHNKRQSGQLVVAVSACNALRGGGALEPLPGDDSRACRMVVGNNDVVTWSDSLVAFITFYHVLKKTGEFTTAIRAMKTAASNDSFFGLVASEDPLRA